MLCAASAYKTTTSQNIPTIARREHSQEMAVFRAAFIIYWGGSAARAQGFWWGPLPPTPCWHALPSSLTCSQVLHYQWSQLNVLPIIVGEAKAGGAQQWGSCQLGWQHLQLHSFLVPSCKGYVGSVGSCERRWWEGSLAREGHTGRWG